MITYNDLDDLVAAARFTGLDVHAEDLNLLTWEPGIHNHIPIALPIGFSAVYIFKHNEVYLKVGKAGLNNTPRYQSHHYYQKAPSTLAKSLLAAPDYAQIIGEQSPKEWICTNTSRYNILIPHIYNKHFVNFVEAYFILKCNPRFGG